MPFVSEAQRRYMWAQHPDIARRWAKHTPKNARLPEHVGDLRGLGQTNAAGAMGAVVVFGLLGLGVVTWFLISAGSGRYQ